MTDDLQIGVIGSGGRGGLARHAHRPGDGSRVVACCDIEEEVFDSCRDWYGGGIFTTSELGELLDRDLDAIFVTTPDFLHERHAVEALHAGKAVYLEKPMAITIEGCDRILKAACESGSRLYLGHNMRHMSVIRKMKELIDGGAIGKVKAAWCRHFVGHGGDFYFKDWHAERRNSTSLLLQKGAHDIDVIHWLCGGYTRRVTGMGALTVYDKVEDRGDGSKRMKPKARIENWPPLSQTELNPVIDVEDISMILMELDNGVLASYQQCHYTPDYWRNYTIIGTEGRLENFGDHGSGSHLKLWNRRCNGYNGAGDEHYDLEVSEGGHGGSDVEIVKEFLRFVRVGGATDTSPIAARYSVATGCQAADSLRNGSIPREIPPVSEEFAEYFVSQVTVEP